MIANRPKRWTEVIGQDRVVRVLHALLRTPQFMTRGMIFEGPYAVGKTSCAYLFAKALMCLDEKQPLGCGSCPSCVTADRELGEHNSFMEVDAASHSGVEQARALMARLDGPSNLGKRHVVLIDEAHRLSENAWDVFLKPLELGDTTVVFLFVTTDLKGIPDTIQSRCAKLRFGMVSTDDLMGKLMAIADQKNIPYTSDGLRAVAESANGRPRDAVLALALVAATGQVTRENAEAALNQDSGIIAGEIFLAVMEHKIVEAADKADRLAQRIGPVRLIETMFSLYARDIFDGGAVAEYFAPLKEMSAFFLKWNAASHLPADIVPLFVMELSEMLRVNYQPSLQTASASATQSKLSSSSPSHIKGPAISEHTFNALMGATS
jgi:DNA polymerase-3 subunit gamma/tau